jgi:hypothetical protein
MGMPVPVGRVPARQTGWFAEAEPAIQRCLALAAAALLPEAVQAARERGQARDLDIPVAEIGKE